MKSTRLPRVSIVPFVMVLIGMTLLGVTLAASVDAAPVRTNVSRDDRVKSQAKDCEKMGGASSTHHQFDEAGDLISVQVSCEGGAIDGLVCDNTETTVDCYQGKAFVQPTQQVVPEQRPDTAAPVENPQQTRPVVDDIAAPPGGVAEDPTEDEQARIVDPATACEALGGTVTVIGQGATVPVDIRCTGGTLDDMICYGTICDYFATGPAGPGEGARVPTTGEIEFVQVESEADLEAALRGLAEDPTGDDTVVIVNQVAANISDNATNQKLACEGLGGTATVIENRTVGGGLKWVDVICTGGALDGLYCANSTGYPTSCFFWRTVLPEDPRVTPVAGIEAPAGNVPTATVVATEASAPPTATSPVPTVAPTAVAAEPTVAPPSDPPPPRNDNSVPPGDSVEPVDPTPTPVVLL